jgi:hypothetical protein
MLILPTDGRAGLIRPHFPGLPEETSMTGIEVDGHTITFKSTGRRLDIAFGVVGLSPDLRVHEGFDSDLEEMLDDPLTREERRDLADYMIALWTKFRDTVK